MNLKTIDVIKTSVLTTVDIQTNNVSYFFKNFKNLFILPPFPSLIY